MKNFSIKMPLGKSLSYAFARVSGRDVLCSRMGCAVKTVKVCGEFDPRVIVGRMNTYTFMWYEARPVSGETGLYAIVENSYRRNGWDSVSGNHRFSQSNIVRKVATAQTGKFFTRAEAVELLQRYEKELLNAPNVSAVEKAPATLKALSVHRRVGAGA